RSELRGFWGSRASVHELCSAAVIVLAAFARRERRLGEKLLFLLDLDNLLGLLGSRLADLCRSRRRSGLLGLLDRRRRRLLGRSLRGGLLHGRSLSFLLLLGFGRLPGLFGLALRQDLLADRIGEAGVDGRSGRKDVQAESFQLGQNHLVLNCTL